MNVANYYIESYGCTANTSATELMNYLLEASGHRKVDSLDAADFAVINTCVVKATTENRMKSLLQQYSRQLPLVVAGCLPQVMADWCKNELPNVALLGVDHFKDINSAAAAVLQKQDFEVLSREQNFCTEIHRHRYSTLTGIIEISKGCLGECAYCIVKLAKGRLVSKPVEQITLEVKQALADGCKEIWLTSQDLASYGLDLGTTLPVILHELTALPGDFWIRLGMMNADYALPIVDELVHYLQDPKVYTFLHIPLQSGSNRVLALMKRKYTVEEYEQLIASLRRVPQLTLSTDVIAGFPGETAADFQETMAVLKKIQFDIVNISKYGDRKGTVASKSREKLPTEVVKERSKALTTLVSEMTLARNRNWLGWEGEALALKREKENWTLLRNKAYKLIAVKDSSLVLGEKYRVKVTAGLKTRLQGEIL